MSATILRPAPALSKPAVSNWTIDLAADALDGLYAEPTTPPLSPPRQLWTWLCDRVPLLRRWRGGGQAAIELHVSPERKAELLAALCDAEVREAVLAILSPGIEAIARRSGGAA